VVLVTLLNPIRAASATTDFSGAWVLDRNASDVATLGQVEYRLSVTEGPTGIQCSTGAAEWSYLLDGTETRKQIADETRSSMVKWEGAALLINTQVTGPRQYTVMDRWELSHDRKTLTISRQIVNLGSESEGTLVFRREGAIANAPPAQAPPQPAPATAPPPAVPPAATPPAAAPIPPPQPADQNAPAGWRKQEAPANPSEPVLIKRPETTAPGDFTVPAGTHVLLTLVGDVNTKYAKEGDHVYLRTASPVAANGRVVIPRNSDVQGTITKTKPAGVVVGKGELYIRFDSLILPNGVSRDFRARPKGEEGKVDGQTKSADGRTVAEGAGAGAVIGALTHGLGGAAVGGGIGALAGVLMSRNKNVVLKSGTHIEMVLDRDLVFHPDELPDSSAGR